MALIFSWKEWNYTTSKKNGDKLIDRSIKIFVEVSLNGKKVVSMNIVKPKYSPVSKLKNRFETISHLCWSD